MRVCFTWTLTGRRGPRMVRTALIARTRRTLLAGLALSAALTSPLPGSPAARAASFDEPDRTTSVLVADPLAREPATLALVPAPTTAPMASVLAADDADAESPAPAADGQSHHAAAPATSCTAALDGGEACGCPACSGSRSNGGVFGTLAEACRDRGHGPLGDCDPPGLFQRLADHHKKSGACWSGRADVLLLWRNAPPSQALLTNNVGQFTALDAGQVESALAAGPRFSIFRTDACGDAWEATYLRAFNFRGQRTLPTVPDGYDIALPGIFGDTEAGLDGASMNLGSGIQSFEFNRYGKVAENIRLLAGFRWVEWRESATLTTAVPTGVTDIYQSNVYNSLYGGQIGFDANVLQTRWLRVESVMKGGAYGNNVAATSLLVKPDVAVNETFALSQQPAACAFVGELGFTGVIPITCCLDLRVGYFGMWLQGLAQPTRQFLTQDLMTAPPTGTLDTKGGTVIQGVSLGLEGRW